jgi:allantoin racemase
MTMKEIGLRLLLANPNTTDSATQLMAETAASVAAAGTRIVAVTAPRGMPYISSRAEAQIGGAIALEMIADHLGQIDAAIVAAFGDPGVWAARELFDIPIVGVSEAAMLTACMLGQRFAIVTFNHALVGWYRDCVECCGLSGRCAGVFALDISFADAISAGPAVEDALVSFAERVIADNGADSLIFGGAPLAGLARRARDRISAPIVDPVTAAVKQAEALVALRPRKAIAGSFQRPPAKTTQGLGANLAAWIEHATGGAA